MIGVRLTGNRCQCAGCGLLFSSTREFDRHRIGAYSERKGGCHGRRCLSVQEMVAKAWRCNARGFWMQPRREAAPVGPRSGAQGGAAGGAAGESA